MGVASPVLVECPASMDVVFKVGTSNLSHPGNAMHRELLEAHSEDFRKTTSIAEKLVVVNQILADVVKRNGRILEWSNATGTWVVMQDTEEIRMKMYNSMMYYHRTLHAKKNLQSNTSSTYIFERQDGRKRKRGLEATACCS